ncbi:hypothetical protein ILUMI_12315 [Ignelater luminosus]|uniref:ATP-dependent (S)-NAD(P)H-hydrate dehydratase n=1 Tax=Ignelater luminosus TaxID=2038154 RepID=A0A8K0CUI8_IGNLU|nr:hypothetical protein ILUMI_12315 [Ignelater luminosus]
MDEKNFAFTCKQLAPPLANDKHKGQAGRIGVFGGSLEYTGAPYFAAISALKVGADLVHVFCAKEAGIVIKSYSPELIVHPLLDDHDAVKKIEPWLERLHVILIGPGLGREPSTLNVVTEIINLCRAASKPLVIDADGLYLIAQNLDIIRDYPPPGVILTPNVMEYARLLEAENAEHKAEVPRTVGRLELGRTITVLRKGPEDDIMDYAKRVRLSGGGSGRRCGGQGDLLAGAVSTFYAWALQHKMEEDVDHDDRAMIACYAACKLTRKCNERAFAKKGRAMVCSDMIEEISGVFKEKFEPQ